MKRRSFIQVTTAAFAAMALPAEEIFRKMRPVAPTLTPLPRQEAPSLDGRYVYNPGLDIDGVQDLTFHQHSVIPGGKITRIDSAMPWNLEGRLPEGRIMEVRKEKDDFGRTIGRYAATCYTADEILGALMMSLSTNSTASMLVEIPQWRGQDIALDKINEAIYSATLEGRENAIRGLPRRWMIKGDLQKLTESIALYRETASALLKQRLLVTEVTDRWQKNLLVLLGNADEFTAARATDRLTSNAEEVAAFRRRMAEKILSEAHDPFRSISTLDFRARVRARITDVS